MDKKVQCVVLNYNTSVSLKGCIQRSLEEYVCAIGIVFTKKSFSMSLDERVCSIITKEVQKNQICANNRTLNTICFRLKAKTTNSKLTKITL